MRKANLKLRGTKKMAEILRGTKKTTKNLRGTKKMAHSGKNAPGGYPFE